jgi:hypothetical protein
MVVADKIKRPRGRPADRVFSVSEVAALMELPENLVRARLRVGAFFPGAVEAEGGEWRIPESALRFCLGCKVRPLYSIKHAAQILGLGYHTLFKITAAVSSLDAPLPIGKRLRALLLFLSDDTEAVKRVHEDELLRFQGLANKS